MLNIQLRRKGREGFSSAYKLFELLNWSPAPEIPVAIFYSLTAAPRGNKCNYFAAYHWTNTAWTEWRAEWSEVICLFHQQEEGIPALLGFAQMPILCLPMQEVQVGGLHHELCQDTLRRSESPSKHQTESFHCQVWVSSDVHHLWQQCCLPAHPKEFKALILSHKNSFSWWCSGATRIPALQLLKAKVVSPDHFLEFTPNPALEICLVDFSNVSLMSWRLSQQGCQRSRKGGRSAGTQLAHWLCMWAAGSWPAIPFISGFVCLLENLLALWYKQECKNWAGNTKKCRSPNLIHVPLLYF